MPTEVIVYRCIKNRIPYLGSYAAAWVTFKALRACGLRPRLVGLTYGQRLPDYFFKEPYKELNVYVLDFCLPTSDLYRLHNNFSKVLVIDYHKTSHVQIEEVLSHTPENDWLKYLINNKCSGAVSAWQYWFPDQPVPPFILYIQDYVLHFNDFADTEKVIASYNWLGVTFPTFNRYYNLGANFVDLARGYGAKELEKSKKKAEDLVEEVELGEIAGHKEIPFVRLYGMDYKHTDIVGTVIKDKYPEAKFTAVLHDEYSWRLYARHDSNEIDVGSISRKYGGGGTKTEAEYTLPLERHIFSQQSR